MERAVLSVFLFCSGLVFATTALAQEIFKDGFDEPVVLLPTEITDFSALPSTVEEGQPTTISWTTENADNCTATAPFDDFNGPVATNGSVEIIIATAGSYDFTLTCEGELDPANAMLTVTVEEKTTTTNCDVAPLTGVIKQWSDFWEVNFPGPVFSTRNTVILKTGYVALEFDTADIVDSGYLESVGNTLTGGTRLGAISECPGDFNVADACEHSWGLGRGITWTTDPGIAGCSLKANTKYYFNVTFTDGIDPTSSTCESELQSGDCIATLQHVNQ